MMPALRFINNQRKAFLFRIVMPYNWHKLNRSRQKRKRESDKVKRREESFDIRLRLVWLLQPMWILIICTLLVLLMEYSEGTAARAAHVWHVISL